MNKNIRVLAAVIFAVFFIISASYAQVTHKSDLNGLWVTTTKDTNDATVIVYQEGNEVRMMCTFDYNGKKVAWYSQGTINGNNVKTRFRITPNTKPQGWENDGTHDLILSPDGNLLSGTGKSLSGFSYKIQFKRIR
ncbi:MAG: hypothetical protein LLF28_06425 [Nitrospiraceae bacterium]|nr:hypothetical protein [Nitrospiraceae bacterium]